MAADTSSELGVPSPADDRSPLIFPPWVGSFALPSMSFEKARGVDMAKRRLTPEEKSRLIKVRCNEAVTAHPDKMIFVRVDDETDGNGEAIVWVHFGWNGNAQPRARAPV